MAIFAVVADAPVGMDALLVVGFSQLNCRADVAEAGKYFLAMFRSGDLMGLCAISTAADSTDEKLNLPLSGFQH